MTGPIWMTIRRLVEVTGLSANTVSAWIYRLPVRAVGNRTLIDAAPIARLLQRGKWIDVATHTDEQRAALDNAGIEPWLSPAVTPSSKGAWRARRYVGSRDLERVSR